MNEYKVGQKVEFDYHGSQEAYQGTRQAGEVVCLVPHVKFKGGTVPLDQMLTGRDDGVARNVADVSVEVSYQDRVVEEKRELDEKIEKLTAFIFKGSAYKTLPEDEQNRLNRQHAIMTGYSQVLGERIANF